MCDEPKLRKKRLAKEKQKTVIYSQKHVRMKEALMMKAPKVNSISM